MTSCLPYAFVKPTISISQDDKGNPIVEIVEPVRDDEGMGLACAGYCVALLAAVPLLTMAPWMMLSGCNPSDYSYHLWQVQRCRGASERPTYPALARTWQIRLCAMQYLQGRCRRPRSPSASQ